MEKPPPPVIPGNGSNFAGKVLGTCILEKLLRRGGMSAVYLAQQVRPSRYVAVKVLLPNVPRGSSEYHEFLVRFRREADLIAKLEHINIVPIFEYGEQDGLAYLVMPYLTGGSLRDLMRRQGALSLPEAASYVDQAASALDYAHTHGVIHRDLKPGNILFHSDGRLVLSDFGIARMMQEENGTINATLTGPGILLGTPDYMSPEMIKGEQIDHRSDIYELGIVLFEMLSGDVPFKEERSYSVLMKHLEARPPLLHQVNPAIPPAVDAVIQKATAKRREERFATAGALARALRTAIAPPDYPAETISHFAPTVPAFRGVVPAAYAANEPIQYSRKEREDEVSPSIPQTLASLPRRPQRFLPIFFLIFLAIALVISGIVLASARAFKGQEISQVPAPAPAPSQQARALVQQYYAELNRWDYQGAYTLVQGNDYCSFVDNYADTLHDDITFNNITPLSAGTVKVDITIKASEELTWGMLLTTYQASHTLGPVNGTWKILADQDTLTKIQRITLSGPTPAITPGTSPSQQAQALVQQFHDDINLHDYPAAYNLWGAAFQKSTDYCAFLGRYAPTLHEVISFDSVTPLSDGTVQVVATINATEENNSQAVTKVYQETYIVGAENNAWRILRGAQQSS